MAAKATGKKKVKQQRLGEDWGPHSHQDIDDAAEHYDTVKRKRCKLSKDEDEAKDALIDKMTAHNLTRYKTADGLEVTIVDRKNVKTKKAGEEE